MSPSSALNPTRATVAINELAANKTVDWTITAHFTERLMERDLIMSDVIHLLKTGHVYDQAETSTNPNFFRYKVQGKTPNSHNRDICVVVIPDSKTIHLKLVTIYWKDE